jgi:D-alanine-D-alanine ligase
MNIAVLMGGTSEERSVSLASGRAVMDALRSGGHEVHAVDTARGYVPPDEEDRLLGATVGATPPDIRELAEARRGSLSLAVAELPVVREADVAFIVLHGGEGENGKVQAVLEMADIPFTGTGHLGCAIAMDKRLSKQLFGVASVPTPAWMPAGAHADGAIEQLGLPLIVKPSNGGSTVGLSLVRDPAELKPAIAEARRYDEDVLVERYVEGREITVAVLEGEALPAVEIFPGHELYDYESKYTPGTSRYETPAHLEPEAVATVSELALRAHNVLRQGSFSRVDFRYGADDGVFYCLEGNSVPGMTATSLFPKAATAAGIPFSALCERLTRAAVAGTE